MKTAWLLLFPCLALAQVTEELRVVYKDIRVHIVDSDGAPVKGLTIDDFLIKENGKFREIGYFEEVNLKPEPGDPAKPVAEIVAEAKDNKDPILDSPPQLANRYLVMFLDSSHMTKGVFDEVKTAVSNFIDENVTDQDYVKVVHMDKRLDHLSGFVKNKDQLKQAIGGAGYEGRMRRDLTRIQRSINDGIQEWDTVDESFRPGLEGGINADIREKARLKMLHYQTFYYNMLYVSRMLEHMRGPKSIYLFTSGSYLEFNSRFNATNDDADALGRSLNSANATVYTMLSKSTAPLEGGTRDFNLRNSSPDFALALNSFSEFPPNPTGLTEIAANTIVEDNDALESGPRAASDTTGGLYLSSYNAADIQRNLGRVDKVANHYYRIVYPLNNPDRITKIDIDLTDKQRGWKVLYGKEFERQLSYTELKRKERDVAFGAMMAYSQSYRNDLDAKLTHHLFARKGGGYVAPVLGETPIGEIPKKGFEFGFAALDENRELLDLTSAILTDIPPHSKMNHYDVLLTDKPPRYIRASVRNMDTGDLTFYEMPVDPRKTAELAEARLSDVVLTDPKRVEQNLGINHLRMMKGSMDDIGDLKNASRQEEDPFRFENRYFKPSVAPYDFEPGALLFMFHLENPVPDAKYQMQFLVQSPKGYHQAPGRLVKEWQPSNSQSIRFQGALNASKLPKGDYVLWIRLTDTQTQKAYIASARFAITPRAGG